MGYYVNLTESYFCIPTERSEDAVKIYDNLWPQHRALLQTLPLVESSETTDYRAVLSDLLSGMDLENDFCDHGTTITDYNGKWNAMIESYFQALAPIMSDNSYMSFVGEDGHHFRLQVENGVLVSYNGVITWERE
jgi:hypothetical protein